ncbi:MAG: FkbM family methyltransferase [Patescibacteria group bacterium]|jgi:FkbM family methyltransferase
MIKNVFIELYKKYTSKLITKEEYIDLAFKYHNTLYDYADYLSQTDIESIHISRNEVKMTTKKEKLILTYPRNDKRIAPFEVLNFKNFEGDFFSFYLQIIKNAKVIFDIGANIGWHDLCAAKLNKKVTVHSFEPIKESFKFLLKNIKVNNLKNIIPNNFGLSNKTTTAIFYVNPYLSASASERMITDQNVKKVKVILKKLDDYCLNKKIKRIDLIKCDVEGAELFVLQGSVNTLKKLKPILLIEILRKWSLKYNYHPNDILKLMDSLDYLCFTIYSGKMKRIFKVTEMTKATNFIFFHKIKHHKYINKYVTK